MSISIGIIGIDGIVLATDDRVTLVGSGIQKHRDGSKKMWIFKEKYGLMSVNTEEGTAAWLINQIKDSLEHPESLVPDIKAVESIKTMRSYNEFVHWVALMLISECRAFLDVKQMQEGNPFSFGFTLAGYQGGEAQIHLLHSRQLFIPSLKNDYCIGGITPVADYYMQKLWTHLFKDKGDKIVPLKNTDALKKLATLMIVETHKNNDSVSDNITLKIINSNGSRVETISREKIKDIKDEVSRITDDTKLVGLLNSN